jgi:hypothetical protein
LETKNEGGIKLMEKYVLLHPTQPNSGLFAFIWQTLRGMYHYPNNKYHILFGRECCYFDNDIYHQQGVENVWEYYFEQPHINSIPSEEQIIAEVGLLFDEFSEFRDVFLEPEVYKVRRSEYHEIIKNNLKLLPHVSEKLEAFYNDNFVGKKVLGLHCRGTDHPDKKPMHLYINEIDNHLKNYDAIFVTSDEQARVDYIKNIFKDRVITYPTFRSLNEGPLHYQNNYSHNKYFIGEEVIIEAYLLSRTDFLLCCTGSNVNFFIRCLNKNIKYKIIETK